MNIAIVHDDFMQYGGAEKLVGAMLKTFPQADLYTSIYDPAVLKLLDIPERKVTASFMQKIPFKKAWYRAFFFLYPLAFEYLSSLGQFDRYKLVISSTARFAHGVLIKPNTVHIAYVNSPGRMWWEPRRYFSKKWQVRFFAPFAKWLKFWDKAAMSRVDVLVANSKNIAKKVESYYGKKADAVIYPFCERSSPTSISSTNLSADSEYFLVVARLSLWKRVDIAVEAFRKNPDLGSLIVVGRGPDKSRLKRLARGAKNIAFLSGLTDSELTGYYKQARALIITQEEDFGITPLEAMGIGTPVVALGRGGVLETVVEGKHGVFFSRQTASSLVGALKKFSQLSFDGEELKKQAGKFSKRRFQTGLKRLVNNYV